MNRLLIWLVSGIVALSLLTAAGPTLIALAHAAVPPVIAVGLVAAILRLVWHFTSRY